MTYTLKHKRWTVTLTRKGGAWTWEALDPRGKGSSKGYRPYEALALQAAKDWVEQVEYARAA